MTPQFYLHLYSKIRSDSSAKLDDAGKGASYTYTPAGRLASRTWGRSSVASPMVTTYAYDSAGQLTTTDYSDTTPDVTVTLNRLGQPLTVTQANQSRIANSSLIESVTATAGAVHTVTNTSDRAYQYDNCIAEYSGTTSPSLELRHAK